MSSFSRPSTTRGKSRGGFRGRGRSSGRGGGRGRGDLKSHSGESFEFNVCRFYVKNTCNKGDQCQHDHVVTLAAEVNAAPQRTPVNAMAQWLDNNVLTASNEGCVKLWSTQDGKSWAMGAKVDFHQRLPVSALQESNGLLFCGYEAPFPHAAIPVTVGMLRIITMQGASEVEVVLDPKSLPYAHTHKVTCIAVGMQQPTGAVICTGGEEGTVRLWKSAGQAFVPAGTLEGHVRAVTSMIFVGTLLWSASLDMTIRVWDVANSTCIGVLSGASGVGHTAEVTCMTGPLQNEGDPTNYIVTGSADKTLRVWNAATGDKVYDHDCSAKITALASFDASPAGPLIIVGLEDGTIAVRDFPGFSLAFEVGSSHFQVGHYHCAVRSLLPLKIPGPQLFFMSGGDDGKMMMWQMNLPGAQA